MSKIKFYERSGIVHVSYYQGGKRVRKTTQILVDGWDKDKQKATGFNSEITNERLDQIKNSIQELTGERNVIFSVVSEEYANKTYSSNGERLAERTLINKRTCHNHIMKFEEETNMSLDITFCNRFNNIDKPIKRNVCEKYAQKLKEYFGNKSKSTLSQYMGYVKSVLLYAKDKYDIEVNTKMFSVKPPSYDVEFLDQQRFTSLVNSSYENKENVGAYACLLACFTGARIGEILSWTYKDNVRLENNKPILVYVPLKNKKHQDGVIKIPINENLYSVIEYHKDNNTKNDYMLYGYTYHNVRLLFNSFLEELDFMKEERSRIRLDAEDNVIHNNIPLSKMITFHKIRASFISNMVMMGIPVETIKKFSGHTQDSRSFPKYVNVDREHLDDSYNKFVEQVDNTKNFSIFKEDEQTNKKHKDQTMEHKP